jgi:hypothetical protein
MPAEADNVAWVQGRGDQPAGPGFFLQHLGDGGFLDAATQTARSLRPS